MNFQPIPFILEMPMKNTKTIIYKNTQIPIDFDVLKRNSNYFEINSQNYNKTNEIKLLEEEGDTVDFSIKAVQDFLLCCQNQKIEINPSNIFYLNYLSKKYSVVFLERKINQVITQNKGELAINSLLFKLDLNINRERMVETEEEEIIIFLQISDNM